MCEYFLFRTLRACNCLKGDVAEAMKYLMGAVQISPKNVDAYYYLADAYRQAGIFDIALDTCERGLAVSPNHKGLEELSWKIEKCIKGEVE
jgi:tetratricopeptide (TPR) repeat protein